MQHFFIPDYILFFISVLNFILSIFIFTNDPKNKINKSFAFFAFFISFWPITLLFFRNVEINSAEVWMKISYIAAAGIAISFWFFVHRFPSDIKKSFWNTILPIFITIILSVLFFLPDFLVKDIYKLSDGSRSATSNWYGHIIFSFYFVGFFFGAIVLLWKKFHSASLKLKKQAQILFYGVLLSGIFGAFFNLILPSPYFQNFSYIYIGPLCTFLFVVSVSYAVAKHQLMNIKALATEFFVIVVFLLSVIQIIYVRSWGELSLRLIFALLILLFGVLLIRSVLDEVKRREEVTQLAHSLEKANLKLQELDRQKTEFLSIASHQLRTPLSIMKGYIELIEDGAFGKPTKKIVSTLDEMDESNERLVKLVDEFLDITRIEQGRTKFDFVVSDLKKLTDSVVKELNDRATDKGLKIQWKPKFKKMNVYMDEEKVRHVIFNFIDNAIKYSETGIIKVFLERCGSVVKLRVIDNGIGFNKEDEVNFFQKFYRGNNVKGTNVTGTGLGIYVCKKFIENHGGSVWAKSPGIGKGGEFGFRIPTKK